MTDIVRPGSGLIYMKVGTHAQETLDDIIARKRREIDDAGLALWGYGGNTCHPLTRVQPFARDYIERDGVIYLCMQPMQSRHFAPPARASESSADGVNWTPIPEAINVLGSRYAMAIADLREEEFELPLSMTKVAAGPRAGLPGDAYLSGRVDKACLEMEDRIVGEERDPRRVRIGLVARLVDPYAVLLR